MIARKEQLAGERISNIIAWLNDINQLSTLPIIVLDVDETIFINFHKHWLVWKQWIDAQRFPKEELHLDGHNYVPLYDFADFCAHGGSMVYQQFFKDPNVFLRYNNENMMSPDFNRDLQPVGNILEAMKFISSLIECYLTARPESVKALTIEELSKHAFPNPDQVICAGASGAYFQPHALKIAKLRELQAKHPGKKIILVDDSVSTYRAIRDLHDPLLQAILFAGAGTPKEQYAEAKGWLDILEMLAKDLEFLRSQVLLQLLG